jgi:phospholipid/cholesterol/gamma-HCH transport system substrate-binding protein
VANLAQGINQALGDEQGQQRIFEMMDRAVIALDEFSKTMRSIEEVVADEGLRDGLQQALTDLPAAVRDVRNTMQDAGQVLQSFDKVILSADKNLRNLEGLTEPLGRSGQDLIDAALTAVEGVDRLMEEINVFGRSITTSTGTVGQLLNDRELYDNFNNLAANANALIWQLNERAKDLRPILGDIRVFTDKVAREPGRVVGGALNRGPGVK